MGLMVAGGAHTYARWRSCAVRRLALSCLARHTAAQHGRALGGGRLAGCPTVRTAFAVLTNTIDCLPPMLQAYGVMASAGCAASPPACRLQLSASGSRPRSDGHKMVDVRVPREQHEQQAVPAQRGCSPPQAAEGAAAGSVVALSSPRQSVAWAAARRLRRPMWVSHAPALHRMALGHRLPLELAPMLAERGGGGGGAGRHAGTRAFALGDERPEDVGGAAELARQRCCHL